MMKLPLGQRLFEGGKPNPEFALLGTVNWMRALAMLTQASSFESDCKAVAQRSNPKREVRPEVQDLALEKLFLSESYVAATRAMAQAANPHDVARVAIVSWYYSVYFGSQAMLGIAGHEVPDEHRKTARVWLNQLVAGPSQPLVPYPFDASVSSLVKKTADAECAALSRGTGQTVNSTPSSKDHAHDAHVSYLKGSSGFYREKEEERVKASREFRDGGFQNFKTRKAQALRDAVLEKRSVGFLEMAFRYRGKANYRDAIFICYGSYEVNMKRFLEDLHTVAAAYHRVARDWVQLRLPSADWKHFVSDIGKSSRLTAP